MSFYALHIILLALILWLPCASSDNFTNCSTKLPVLEKALFSTGQNQFNLSKEFHPPRKLPSRYIKVIYTFQDEDGYPDNECTVEYYWAIESSLLIQPPTIFTFTSLLFSPANNDIKKVFLELPYECRGLVVVTTKGTCSCKTRDNNPLDVLTHQLKQYSKFSDPSQVIRDDASNVKAICAAELKQRYLEDKGVDVYLAATLLFPIIIMAGIAVITQCTHEAILEKLSQPSNHPNLAGFMLTGVWLSIYVTILDLVALGYLHNYEYSEDHNLTNSFPIAGILAATFVLNLYFLCVCVIFSLLYLHGPYNEKDNKCKKLIVMICLHHIYVNYGSKAKDLLISEKPKKDPSYWALISMVTSLFSFASHAGYIMIAWLTEPSKTTAIALVTIGVYIILFLTFRQCYVINKKPSIYCFNVCSLYRDIFCKEYRCCKKNEHNDERPQEGEQSNNGNITTNKSDNDAFNINSYGCSVGWSTIILLCIAFILAAFIKVPLSTVELPLYLENITQILIVVFTFLVTYKFLTINDKDIQKFLKSLRKNPKTLKDISNTTDDFEAAGELTAVVIDKVSKMKDP